MNKVIKTIGEDNEIITMSLEKAIKNEVKRYEGILKAALTNMTASNIPSSIEQSRTWDMGKDKRIKTRLIIEKIIEEK